MDIRYGQGDPADISVRDRWERADGPVVGTADGADVPVTFLWRGTARRVTLVGLADYGDLRRTDLRRLPDSDLWYLTLLLPAGLRAGYGFAIDEPHDDVRTRDRWVASTGRWQPDPRNPRTFTVDHNTDGVEPNPAPHTFSVLALPGAEQSPWPVNDSAVPAGAVHMHWFRAADTGLDTDHRVWVYVPVGADDGPHPVAVLFDGDCYVGPLVPTPTILDNLIAAGRIPPTFALLVDSVGETRADELRGSPRFVSFLTDQLLPWATQRWPITAEPGDTLVGGSSLGGTCASYSALRAPGTFGLVLSQSGAFQQLSTEFPAGLPELVVDRPRLPIRWYLEAGRLETDRGSFPSDLLSANRRMHDVLTDGGYPLRYNEFVGGHDYLCWRETLADGLVYLLGRENG